MTLTRKQNLETELLMTTEARVSQDLLKTDLSSHRRNSRILSMFVSQDITAN